MFELAPVLISKVREADAGAGTGTRATAFDISATFWADPGLRRTFQSVSRQISARTVGPVSQSAAGRPNEQPAVSQSVGRQGTAGAAGRQAVSQPPEETLSPPELETGQMGAGKRAKKKSMKQREVEEHQRAIQAACTSVRRR